MEEFNFEKLEVWQKAVDFADRVLELTENLDPGKKELSAHGADRFCLFWYFNEYCRGKRPVF